jgi:replication-associated recombination protein RarA
MKKQLSYTLWTEKYRPEKVKDMLLPSNYTKFFKELVKDGEVPNLLLYSSTPGTGKTLYTIF